MLRLGGLEITRLSGPVSFTYLLPKRQVFHENAEKGIYLPVVILIGDAHESEENRCDDCEEEKGCYKLESKIFLGALNQLASRIPIDFYAEIFSDAEVISKVDYVHQSRVGIIPRVLESTSGCWDISRSRCDFKNIKWHKSDPRKASGTIESQEYLGHLIKQVENIETGDYLYSPEKKILGNLYITFLYTIHNSIITGDTIEKFIKNLARNLSKEIIGNKKSIIYKQIIKSNVEFNLELYFYSYVVTEFSRIQFDILQPIRDVFNDINIIKPAHFNMSIEDILQSLIRSMNRFEPITAEMSKNHIRYQEIIEIISQIYLHFIEPSLVDLYYTFRMIKTPKDSTNSYLAIAHFGDDHCSNIIELLTNEMQYYDVFRSFVSEHKSSTDEMNRCIFFDTILDVDSFLLEEYREMRSRYEK